MINGDLRSELRFHDWRPMTVDGPKRLFCGHRVGTVWARRVHIRGRGTPAHAWRRERSGSSGRVLPARLGAYVGDAPTLSLACRAELQEVGPAPLRTVSGRASRYLRRRHVLGRGDIRDARSPGTSGGVTPGQGVGNPQKRVAVRRQVHVAKNGWGRARRRSSSTST